MSELKEKIEKGVFWQGLERIGSYGISFIVSIILEQPFFQLFQNVRITERE